MTTPSNTETDKVACRICGEACYWPISKICMRCERMERDIHKRPDLARKILKDLEEK